MTSTRVVVGITVTEHTLCDEVDRLTTQCQRYDRREWYRRLGWVRLPRTSLVVRPKVHLITVVVNRDHLPIHRGDGGGGIIVLLIPYFIFGNRSTSQTSGVPNSRGFVQE